MPAALAPEFQIYQVHVWGVNFESAEESNLDYSAFKKDGTGEPAGAAFLAGAGSGLYWRPDGRALAALDASGAVSVWRTR